MIDIKLETSNIKHVFLTLTNVLSKIWYNKGTHIIVNMVPNENAIANKLVN